MKDENESALLAEGVEQLPHSDWFTWRKGGWHERIDKPAGQDALGQRPVTWPWLLDAMMMKMLEVVTEILAP